MEELSNPSRLDLNYLISPVTLETKPIPSLNELINSWLQLLLIILSFYRIRYKDR